MEFEFLNRRMNIWKQISQKDQVLLRKEKNGNTKTGSIDV